MSNKPLKAAFFDRDGTLNEDVGYLYRKEELRWVEGARECLVWLAQNGYTLFVVTNQSGIARGYYTVEDMLKLHEYMQTQLSDAGVHIEKFYYCPHYENGSVAAFRKVCDCRKPKPGLFMQCFAEYDIDKSNSFMIGDSARDIAAAEEAGINGYLFEGGNLWEFVKNIKQIEIGL